MSKYELLTALFSKGPHAAWYESSNGKRYFGTLESVQREDGGGSSFNVTIHTVGTASQVGGKYVTLHLRTID
jgi:hypothetical protein